jgi:hypothetical protein
VGQVGRPRRRRWPFLLVVVLVLAAALVAGDVAARVGTQNLIATDIRKSTRSDSAQVQIHSFPFLYGVAVQGRVNQVTITDLGVPVGAVRLDRVTLDAAGVHFSRHELLYQHYVHITKVRRATITVVARLSGLVGSLASRLGVQVTAASSDRIVVSALGVTLATVDLTQSPIVPKCPLAVDHSGDSYTFTCTVSPVPTSVLDAMSRLETAKAG